MPQPIADPTRVHQSEARPSWSDGAGGSAAGRSGARRCQRPLARASLAKDLQAPASPGARRRRGRRCSARSRSTRRLLVPVARVPPGTTGSADHRARQVVLDPAALGLADGRTSGRDRGRPSGSRRRSPSPSRPPGPGRRRGRAARGRGGRRTPCGCVEPLFSSSSFLWQNATKRAGGSRAMRGAPTRAPFDVAAARREVVELEADLAASPRPPRS